jgi:hypothetical protein
MARRYSPSPSDEIAAAVFAVLSKKEDWDHLWWISVGLVNDALELDWNSFVNHESVHAKSYCGDLGENLPPKCQPKAGHNIPPCILENISQPCSFRRALKRLEKATMHPKSYSQGRISIILWNEFKEAPYISIHRAAYPWLVAKSGIKRSLKSRKPPLLSSTDPSDYETIAKTCMISDVGKCSAALIPLLQHRSQGDNAYVGAITVCATTDCGIWAHLPHVRAVATSLLETRRHLKALVSRKDKPILDILLDELVADLRGGRNLFDGVCKDTECKIHKTTKDRHDLECRLIRRKTFYTGENRKPVFNRTLESRHFQKSLFSMGKIHDEAGRGVLSEAKKLKNEKPAKSHITTLKSIAGFFRDALGIPLKVKNEAGQCIVWPIRPGLFTLVGLYDVFCVLNRSRHWQRSARRIVASIKNANNKTTVSFEFTLRKNKTPAKLKAGVESDGAGEATRTILNVLYGKPTRELIPQSVWESKIIEALNSRAKDKVVTARFELNRRIPTLYLEWKCERFKQTNTSSSVGD